MVMTACSIHDLTPIPIPVLPVANITQLPALLTAFLSSITTANPAIPLQFHPAPSFSHLLHLSVPSLSEQSKHILSDLFDDKMHALAQACVTSDGRALLREWLEGEEVESVIGFFEHDGVMG